MNTVIYCPALSSHTHIQTNKYHRPHDLTHPLLTQLGDQYQATDIPPCSSASPLPLAQRAPQEQAIIEEDGLVWRPGGLLKVSGQYSHLLDIFLLITAYDLNPCLPMMFINIYL